MKVTISIPEIVEMIKMLGLGPIFIFTAVISVLAFILDKFVKPGRPHYQRTVEPETYEPSTYREPHYPRKNVYRYRASSRKVK